MEDTHITDPDKIERLVFVLAIAFCWAILGLRPTLFRSKRMEDLPEVSFGSG